MTVPPINLTAIRATIDPDDVGTIEIDGDIVLALIDTAEAARAPDWEFVQAVLRDRGLHVTQDDHDAIDRLRESLARYTQDNPDT